MKSIQTLPSKTVARGGGKASEWSPRGVREFCSKFFIALQIQALLYILCFFNWWWFVGELFGSIDQWCAKTFINLFLNRVNQIYKNQMRASSGPIRPFNFHCNKKNGFTHHWTRRLCWRCRNYHCHRRCSWCWRSRWNRCWCGCLCWCRCRSWCWCLRCHQGDLGCLRTFNRFAQLLGLLISECDEEGNEENNFENGEDGDKDGYGELGRLRGGRGTGDTILGLEETKNKITIIIIIDWIQNQKYWIFLSEKNPGAFE